MIIYQILIFILTYIFSSLILGSFFRIFFQKKNFFFEISEISVLSLGISPVIISLFLYFLLFLFPDRTDSFYVSSIGIIFLAAGWLNREAFLAYLKEIQTSFTDFRKKPKRFRFDILFMALLAIAVGVYIFVQAVGYPIASNDGSIYATIGRLLYEQKDFRNFPTVTADEATGFYFGGGQHPPGLSLIYTWFYMFQQNTVSDVLLRTVSPLYTLYLVLLIYLAIKKRGGNFAGIFAVILMVSAPIFIWQAYENSIDPIRLFFLAASFITLGKLLEKESLRLALLLGITLGLSLFIHASGILVLVVIPIIYLLLSRSKISLKIELTCVCLAVSLLFGGWQYGYNYIKYKNILGPDISFHITDIKGKELYNQPELELAGQGGEITSLGGFKVPRDLIYGRLQIFTRPELFGPTYFVFVIGIIYWLRKLRKENTDRAMLLGAILMIIPIIYQYYVNRRYFLTIYPMVVYFGGLSLGDFYQRLVESKKAMWFWSGFLVIFLVGLVFYFAPGSLSSEKLKHSQGGAEKSYLLSNKKKQNKMLAGGLFEAIDFINKQTPPDSVVLTSENGRYYYYAKRYGVFWSEPRMQSFYNLSDKESAVKYLRDLNIDFIIIHSISQEDTRYKDSQLKAITEDIGLSELVFQNFTKIYRLKK